MLSTKSWLKISAVALGAFCTTNAALAASALDFNFKADITEEDYQKLVTPIVTPMRYMFVMPAKTTGLLGFDIGAAGTFLTLPKEVTDTAALFIEKGDSLPSSLVIPRITVQKGLPFGIDLGINASMIPTTQIKLLGIGAQYQLDVPVPVLPIYAAARVGYTTLMGLDELTTSHTNIEALVSTGLPPGVNILFDVEPWVGMGFDFAKAKSTLKFTVASQETSITRETNWNENYVMAGLRLSLMALKISGEAHFSLTDAPVQYTAKVGLGF